MITIKASEQLIRELIKQRNNLIDNDPRRDWDHPRHAEYVNDITSIEAKLETARDEMLGVNPNLAMGEGLLDGPW